MNTAPKIVCAAMLMDDFVVITGTRHFSLDMRKTLERIYGTGFKFFKWWLKKPYHLRIITQGFVDSRGSFLTRNEAFYRVQQTGQCPQLDLSSYIHQAKPELFSEDLY